MKNYDKYLMKRNIELLMIAKDIRNKELDASLQTFQNNRMEQDFMLSTAIQIADALGVTLDSLIREDYAKKLIGE